MLRVRGTSRVLAVLGDPISHSVSPELHNSAIAALGLNAVYVPLRIPASHLGDVLRACAAADIGGNITAPLKEPAAQLIARCTADARALGAVNTFWVEDGELHGDNTDLPGLIDVLQAMQAPAPWLVLGTGGTARAVAAAAARLDRPLVVRSRSPERAAAFCAWCRSLDPAPAADPDDGRPVATVVNATPLGRVSQELPPVPEQRIEGAEVALDLVYQPGETRWIRACRSRGLRAADGRDLLLAQAVYAFERFFPGQRAPREQMRAALHRALRA